MNLQSFLLNEDVTEVVIPAFEGEMGILKDHIDTNGHKDEQDMVLKMDIEGHEIEVFESLTNFYKEFQNHLPKKIIFETHFNVYKKN